MPSIIRHVWGSPTLVAAVRLGAVDYTNSKPAPRRYNLESCPIVTLAVTHAGYESGQKNGPFKSIEELRTVGASCVNPWEDRLTT
jgi:hypothetical protein